MITQKHLEHWISEIIYQLNGMATEIAPNKVVMKGINVGLNGEAFVSFEYLQEKCHTIQGTLQCIKDDIKND